MTKELPPTELLRKLLRYEPETGKLFWRERSREAFTCDRSYKTWNAKNAHNEALSHHEPTGKTSQRYKRGSIFGTNYMAHRVCWAMFYGVPPSKFIDHINGNPIDNRIDNLRDVTKKENSRNQKFRSTNKTGVCGVSWNKGRRSGFWVATISGIHLGSFSCFDDAVRARKNAEIDFGYHENHGRVT